MTVSSIKAENGGFIGSPSTLQISAKGIRFWCVLSVCHEGIGIDSANHISFFFDRA
jgi:hypothetical protein